MSTLKEETLVIENINDIELKEASTEYKTSNNNCILGGDRDFLVYKLREAFKKAKKVDIIVAFLMESGVKLLKKDIEEAVKNKCEIRILTGNYLGITQPEALYLMKDILGENANMAFYKEKNRSFHPKAYIFHYENNEGEVFIGSSNISNSALTKGIEWNYRLEKSQNEEDFNYISRNFEDLFLNQSIMLNDEELKNYSKIYKKPKLNFSKEEEKVIDIFSPRGAQIEALYELKKLRKLGYNKGIVVAATGIGKTYLSAFDSLDFKKVLFVAHREEILKQAFNSYKNVRSNESMGFFNSSNKDNDKNIVFASVQTLGKEEYLKEEYFKKDYFDYIVIDEFHHSVSNNYQNIIKYFKPKFLLGLTATPERLDNKDVFAVCDYNVAYEIRLPEAINRGDLCPFRYYGVFDETVDYTKIPKFKGKFKEKELEKALMLDKRADLIFKHYSKYNSKRALGFCSSKNHAEYMAKYFSQNGVKACAVYSDSKGEYALERNEAIEKLTKGEINIIFSVDMFNEGVDIKTVDMVIFLRPTESQTIFLQQLGRGLRKAKGKEYVNVLDFIGNFKKSNIIPKLLGGVKTKDSKNNPNSFSYPEDCLVDFDFKLVDFYKYVLVNETFLKTRILDEFNSIKEEIGHTPSRVELITSMDDELYKEVRKKAKENPFKDYLKFLERIGEEKSELLDTVGYDFINYIETTEMSRTYKMPILLAFYNKGDFKLRINEDDIYNFMKEFYENPSNGQDLLASKTTKDYLSWDKEKYLKKAKAMPLKALLNTGSEFFSLENDEFILSNKLKDFIDSDSFKENVLDSINMRVIEFYKNRNYKFQGGK
ncbi:DEAD/DEAH box helicase family protein [Clostridium chrysemydis]|uniref:DEAD/DEAH box helicase family protein n=1 Tax=Clostridium chrysemydis TaxID=2665504 RepID=UPI0018844B1F|nr:DEAD/DEAH box helicase family protein [Clostridium chrysemydis]